MKSCDNNFIKNQIKNIIPSLLCKYFLKSARITQPIAAVRIPTDLELRNILVAESRNLYAQTTT
jgi:hypothetical protein